MSFDKLKVSPELDDATDQVVDLMQRIGPAIASVETDVAAWALMCLIEKYPQLAAELDRLRAKYREHHAAHVAN